MPLMSFHLEVECQMVKQETRVEEKGSLGRQQDTGEDSRRHRPRKLELDSTRRTKEDAHIRSDSSCSNLLSTYHIVHTNMYHHYHFRPSRRKL